MLYSANIHSSRINISDEDCVGSLVTEWQAFLNGLMLWKSTDRLLLTHRSSKWDSGYGYPFFLIHDKFWYYSFVL